MTFHGSTGCCCCCRRDDQVKTNWPIETVVTSFSVEKSLASRTLFQRRISLTCLFRLFLCQFPTSFLFILFFFYSIVSSPWLINTGADVADSSAWGAPETKKYEEKRNKKRRNIPRSAQQHARQLTPNDSRSRKCFLVRGSSITGIFFFLSLSSLPTVESFASSLRSCGPIKISVCVQSTLHTQLFLCGVCVN